MSTQKKDWLSKWAPLIVSIGFNICLISFAFGKNEQWKAGIDEKMAQVSRDKLVSYLVTRNEYDQRVNVRDKEMQQNREDHWQIMEKLDRLIDRQNGNKE